MSQEFSPVLSELCKVYSGFQLCEEKIQSGQFFSNIRCASIMMDLVLMFSLDPSSSKCGCRTDVQIKGAPTGKEEEGKK